MKHNEELKTFITIWFIALSSTIYCYFIPARISGVVPRLLSLIPVITIFSILPLQISIINIAAITFFFLPWLGNFKLLLFAFNRGPLSSTPRLPIVTFISLALLPVKPKELNNKLTYSSPLSLPKPIVLTCKTVILITIVDVYRFKDQFHSTMIIVLSFAYMYIALELCFEFIAFLVKVIHGFDFDMEPHFNEPYMSTSLQDFWGRRWNLASSSILRATVYNPTRMMLDRNLGKFRGHLVATFVTFVVSGLMHELMYLYLMRVPPTWEVTWYFVLHGVCTVVEMAVKKAVNDRFCLHKMLSLPLTLGFMFVTGWLFLVQPIRNGMDVKIIHESSALLKYLGVM
ncbi:hypothetical protein QVD17_38594 [Tagetes erecta]|uniref:Wax synthase domain-containing protein n=1 Tax=Tagetes erecta TaxID=13708 RepID=A0AAD8NEE4_TARER|nr:hypothetical protein QVD17_38594 [Tagetes erecta]